MFKNKALIYPTLLIWLFITSTAPFIFYSWPFHPYKILTLVCLSAMVIELLRKEKFKIFKYYVNIVIILVMYYLFAMIWHEDSQYINYIIQLLAFLISTTYIHKTIGYTFFAKTFVYVIMVMGVGGTIIFFLHLLIGISPLFSVDYSDTGTSSFLWLTTTNVYYNMEGGARFIRFSGFFDEPGQFALFSIFAILLNRVYFSNSVYDKILIFTTIFTFSTAFYAFLLLYFILFYINRSNIKVLLVFVTIVVVSIISLRNSTNESTYFFQSQIIERFSFDESTGKFNADNRSDRVKNDKEIFFKYPLLGSGKQHEHLMLSNYCGIWAQFGLIGAFLQYSFLLLYLLSILYLAYKGKSIWLYLKIFFLISINIFHRPDFSSTLICILLSTFIFNLNLTSVLRSKN